MTGPLPASVLLHICPELRQYQDSESVRQTSDTRDYPAENRSFSVTLD